MRHRDSGRAGILPGVRLRGEGAGTGGDVQIRLPALPPAHPGAAQLGHCPACRCSRVIPAPEPELALHPAPPAACAVPLPEPALRPIPAERPIQRDVSAGENGEPEAVPQPLPPKNLSPPLPGYMRSEKTPGVSLGVLIAVIAGGAGVILVAGAFWFFLFR